MQRIAILVVAALLAACETPPVTKEEMSSVDYGPRPTRWQEEIRSYLGIRLTDPKSAIIEFRTEPKQMYQRATDVRDRQWGWAVCVWINDKNSYGAYDGFYPMTVFLRDEKIVAVNNGPDDFGVIGATYARRQCAELGAPFTPRP
jgi:hypothetical protein